MTTWVATPATGAPLLAHLQDEPGRVLCGERRRIWRPQLEFARPDAFTPCPACLACAVRRRRGEK